jgi:hypothetical protein
MITMTQIERPVRRLVMAERALLSGRPAMPAVGCDAPGSWPTSSRRSRSFMATGLGVADYGIDLAATTAPTEQFSHTTKRPARHLRVT